MAQIISSWLPWLDAGIAFSLLPLSLWVLLSGLDDLVVALAFLLYGRRLSRLAPPPETSLRNCRPKHIAIFVPLWCEDGVIARMVAHNLATIRYPNYTFFLGAYPNDEPTLEAVRGVEALYSNVHLAVCPNDGPTSKADCLNWIYQRMLLHEELNGKRFDIVITHDAEDVIHPESLRWINYFADDFGMIQVPVLPLPTPAGELVHGIYCDEFAEYQTKDIPARQLLGGFIPSNGVGTGYTREALQSLAEVSANRIFEPTCLTEDYENGFRLHRLGCRQLFIPITWQGAAPVATREYFPRSFRAAVKQRTRWVMGISLQGWERHGWTGGWREKYWWWRDRKGILGNPVSTYTNAIFFYGIAVWLWSRCSGQSWSLAEPVAGALGSTILQYLLPFLFFIQALFLGIRTGCAADVYGWGFALGVPVRAVIANAINTLAVLQAVQKFASAKWRHQPLVWLKTDHSYPTRAALLDLQAAFPKRQVVA